jgi:hypothetical protein
MYPQQSRVEEVTVGVFFYQDSTRLDSAVLEFAVKKNACRVNYYKHHGVERPKTCWECGGKQGKRKQYCCLASSLQG